MVRLSLKVKDFIMRRKKGLLCLTIILLLMVITGGVYLGIGYFRSLNLPEGTYKGEIDITDQVVTKAALWLSTIDEGTFDVQALEEDLGSVKISVELQIKRTGSNTGNYITTMSQEDYETGREQVNKAVKATVSNAISERLKAAGFDNAEDLEFVDQTITAALGMEFEAYLEACKVDFMPEYEELSKKYNQEGAYSISGEMITWTNDKTTTTDKLVRDDKSFVLTDGDGEIEYPMAYLRCE